MQSSFPSFALKWGYSAGLLFAFYQQQKSLNKIKLLYKGAAPRMGGGTKGFKKGKMIKYGVFSCILKLAFVSSLTRKYML